MNSTQIVEAIKEVYVSMIDEMDKGETGVAAASRRARKLSLEMDKLTKEYRKKTIEASKE